MFSRRCSLRTEMRLLLLLWHLTLILESEAQTPQDCNLSTTNRAPGSHRSILNWRSFQQLCPCHCFTPSSCFPPTLENDDISVSCGTRYMDLSIFICPIYHAFYNESMMVVNNQGNKAECYGMADWTVDPPVLKFRFPLNESSISACNNNFKVFFCLAVAVVLQKLHCM